jgi:hypothetical protein
VIISSKKQLKKKRSIGLMIYKQSVVTKRRFIDVKPFVKKRDKKKERTERISITLSNEKGD